MVDEWVHLKGETDLLLTLRQVTGEQGVSEFVAICKPD